MIIPNPVVEDALQCAVRTVLRKFRGYKDLEELESVTTYAVGCAAANYDAKNSATFKTYAVSCAVYACRTYLRKTYYSLKLTRELLHSAKTPQHIDWLPDEERDLTFQFVCAGLTIQELAELHNEPAADVALKLYLIAKKVEQKQKSAIDRRDDL